MQRLKALYKNTDRISLRIINGQEIKRETSNFGKKIRVISAGLDLLHDLKALNIY